MTKKLISAFVFAARIVQSLCFLKPKFQASSRHVWLYSLVCVGPGGKPRRPVFSQRGSFYLGREKQRSCSVPLLASTKSRFSHDMAHIRDTQKIVVKFNQVSLAVQKFIQLMSEWQIVQTQVRLL